MNQAVFLDKEKLTEPALDVNELRKRGIKIIQQLTGAFWTDYNLHDPGVTILEQLCYALSELSFRTDFDIEQLLFKEGEKDLPFFRPEEILTCNPLSISDLRKYFLDNIIEVKNVWFEPVTEKDAAFNGLYRVLVDLAAISPNDQEVQDIKNKIYGLFSRCRNLCEDIFEIKILEQLPIKICADIETDGLYELSRIMANIYFSLEQNINPEVKFYSLGELKDKGKSYDEIFDGPYLKHGFVLREELIAQPDTIIVSDLVKLMMQVEGVVSVKNLHLEVNGQKYHNQLAVPHGFVPRFIHEEIENEDGKTSVQFFKGNLKYEGFDAIDFRKHLNELVSENKKAFRIHETSFEVPEVKQDLDFESYFSIQNHFPALYGVGEQGLPNRPDVKRKAQANQLKGYLMLFEQFMANYFSQLAHFKDLLSIHKQLNQTYFCQKLDSVPNAEKFYINEASNLKDAYFDFSDIPQNYSQGLEKLNRYFDDFVDRKNRMLEFLLAMHGESYTRYSLSQFNYYYTPREFKQEQIKCKSAFLQQLAQINYNRAAGIDYFNTQQSMSSGLEQKLSIILGLGLHEDTTGKIAIGKKDSLFEGCRKYDIKLVESDESDQALQKWDELGDIAQYGLSASTIKEAFDYIDEEDLNELTELESEQWEQYQSLLLPFVAHVLPTSFLISGVEPMNYMAGQLAGDAPGYALVYQNGLGDSWKLMGKFDTEKHLLYALKYLIRTLIRINIQSEGFHLVEHVLLRPGKNERKYGIYINDASGKHLLKSVKQYTLGEREQILEEVKSGMRVYDNFSVEADDNREMNIVFKIPQKDISFVSVVPDISVENSHSEMENLYRYLADTDNPSPFAEKTGFYVQYEPQGEDIPESYYSYKISLVFPSWTARFNNQEFRSIVKDLVWEQKPATVVADILWLPPAEMSDFEELYNKWTTAGGTIAADEDLSNTSGSAQLAKFLYAKSTSR